MRELFHPTKDQMKLSTILHAAGEPIRLQILKSLADKPEVTCASCNVSLPKSALSHHFKVLRESGLIHVRIEGTQRFLSIRYHDLEECFPGLLKSILRNIQP